LGLCGYVCISPDVERQATNIAASIAGWVSFVACGSTAGGVCATKIAPDVERQATHTVAVISYVGIRLCDRPSGALLRT